MPRVFAALALLSIVSACTSKDDSSAVDASTDAPIACTSSNDCPAQSGCGYPIAESCGATGQCVHVTVGIASCGVDPNLRFCGCDGVSFFPGCAFGTEFYPYPVAHSGACFDGGVSDRPCTSDRDCPEDETACRYAIAEGCAAVGHCALVPGGGSCAVTPVPTECACDGKTFAACLVPEGYAGVPVAHSGACSDGGAADASTDGATE